MFDCLIEKFTTYKPILAAIKKEYDLFISHQNEVIRELLPLQVSEHVHIVCLKRLPLGIYVFTSITFLSLFCGKIITCAVLE